MLSDYNIYFLLPQLIIYCKKTKCSVPVHYNCNCTHICSHVALFYCTLCFYKIITSYLLVYTAAFIALRYCIYVATTIYYAHNYKLFNKIYECGVSTKKVVCFLLFVTEFLSIILLVV